MLQQHLVMASSYGGGGGGATDPNYSLVSALVAGSSGIVDAKGNTITTFGSIGVGTTYVGAGAIEFDAGSKRFTVAGAGAIFAPGTGAFCWEAFVTAASSGANAFALLFDTSNSGSAVGGMFLEYSASRGLYWAQNNGGGTSTSYATFTATTEQHIFVSRTAAGVVTLGVAGTIRARSTGVTANIGSIGTLGVGAYTGSASQSFKGAMRGIRFTNGDHRYTGNVSDGYTVPALPLPTA